MPEAIDHSAEMREKLTASLAKLTVRRRVALSHHEQIQGECARRAESLRHEHLALQEQLRAEGIQTSDDGDVLEKTAFARAMYERLAGGTPPPAKGE